MNTYAPKDTPPDSINNSDETPLFSFFSLVFSITSLVVVAYVLLHLISLTFPYFISMENEQKFLNKNYFFPYKTDKSSKNKSESINQLINELWQNSTEHSSVKFNAKVFADSNENALISPGGHMFISNELLNNIKSENELSFILCHEIAHFYHRDTIRTLGQILTRGLFTAILAGASGGSNISLLAEALISSKFSRDQESSADSFALGCLNKKYGHVNGYSHFFERIKHKDIKALKYSSTHPLSADRIDDLKKIINTKKFSPEGELTPLNISKPLK